MKRKVSESANVYAGVVGGVLERDASMTKDYYCNSTTLLRYTEDWRCGGHGRDGESSQRNTEHELSDEEARRIGRNKSCGEKAKGRGLQVRGFIGSRERHAYQFFVELWLLVLSL